MALPAPSEPLQRRVAGYHDWRLDGITDLVMRAHGASVLDIGCNRGLVGFEFANNGASIIHGCDNYAEGVAVARHVFCDLRNVKSRFEVVDLREGFPAMEKAFGEDYLPRYDIVLMLATYHKIKRIMNQEVLLGLMRHFAERTGRYFAWHSTHKGEYKILDAALQPQLRRVHYSEISDHLGAAAIWKRL